MNMAPLAFVVAALSLAVVSAPAAAQTATAKKPAAKAPAKPAAKAAAAPAAATTTRKVRLAAPADVVGAAKSCSVTITAKGNDASRLSAIGWRAAPVKGGEGAAPFRAYSKAQSPTVIMLPKKSSGQSCIVMSRLATAQDVALVANGLSAEIGQKPTKGTKPGEAVWVAGDRAFQLLPTGTPQAPGVRIAVIHRQGK